MKNQKSEARKGGTVSGKAKPYHKTGTARTQLLQLLPRNKYALPASLATTLTPTAHQDISTAASEMDVLLPLLPTLSLDQILIYSLLLSS